MKKLNLLFLALPLLLLFSCGGNKYDGQRYENATSQSEIDQNLILDYLIASNIDAERTESGIYYTTENAGTGANPVKEDVVKVHYKGYFLDGKTFDSSYERNEPAVFPLARVVQGWQEGIPLFKEGGKGTLYIPSHLAYGPRGAGEDIPPNSIIAFDVEMLDIMDEKELADYQAEMMAKQAEIAEKQKVEDEKILVDYLAKNNIKAEKTEEGIYYTIDKPGSSKKPTIDSKVTVNYEGTLLDGKKFDSSYDRGQPATFPLKGVVPGWQIGIPKFGKGGAGKLYIPSGLAYGPQGSPGGIPPNSCLIFKVEVIDFETPPAK